MPDETITKTFTHKRTETGSEIRIEINPLYRTAMLIFVLMSFGGWLTDRQALLFIGVLLLTIQWFYSLMIWSPAFREIRMATSEDRISVTGNQRSMTDPLTYTIKKF